MTNRKTTRRALVLSLLSLLVCCSMLVGTTFAWFTDSVTSGNNKIVAGNLDIELYWSTDCENWEKVDADTNIFDAGYWEPGHTEVVYLKAANEGTLALKYQLGVNVASETGSVNVLGEDFKLSHYIEYGVVETDAKYADRKAAVAAVSNATKLENAYNSEVITLAPKGEAGDSETVALVVYMPETVGNEANHRGAEPTILLGLNVYATQVEAESDSFGNDYDKNAWNDAMVVMSEADLIAALASEDKVMLGADIALTSPITIPAGSTVALNLNGKTITAESKGNNGVIINEGTLTLVGGTVENTAENGDATIYNVGDLTLDGTSIVGAPIGATGYPSYTIRSSGDLTVEEGTRVSSDRGTMFLSGTATTTINGGTFTNNDLGDLNFTSHVVVVGYGAANELVINDGTFQHLHTKTSGGVVINNWSATTVKVNGGNFSGGNYFGKWDNLSDYGYGSTKTPFSVTGGTFTGMDTKYLAEGTVLNDNGDGTLTVVALSGNTTMPGGAVLNLNGQEITGTVVAEGDLTIMGDTSIKTLKATNGGTITVEEGKTLTLTNFSFGTSANNTAEYTITGGTVEAAYGFFQHGKYELRSNIKTGYMYYSYGSDITVYGTVESEGKGDGLDYVRGKVTIAAGGKSIHQKALWVGQPAGWGAMNATLIVEEGGYVQANSLSIYDGSKLQVAGTDAGEVEGVVCNTINNTGVIEVIGNDALTATVSGNKIVLE